MTIHRYYLTYGQDTIKEPLIYQLGKKFEVVTNIRAASVSDHIGIVALEMEGDSTEIDKAAEWIAGKGVKVEPIEKNVIE